MKTYFCQGSAGNWPWKLHCLVFTLIFMAVCWTIWNNNWSWRHYTGYYPLSSVAMVLHPSECEAVITNAVTTTTTTTATTNRRAERAACVLSLYRSSLYFFLKMEWKNENSSLRTLILNILSICWGESCFCFWELGEIGTS